MPFKRVSKERYLEQLREDLGFPSEGIEAAEALVSSIYDMYDALIYHSHSNSSDVPELPVGGKEEDQPDPRKTEQMKEEPKTEKFDGDDFLRNVFGPEPRPKETDEKRKQREFFFPHTKEQQGFNACECGAAAAGYPDMGPHHSDWCKRYRKF